MQFANLALGDCDPPLFEGPARHLVRKPICLFQKHFQFESKSVIVWMHEQFSLADDHADKALKLLNK